MKTRSLGGINTHSSSNVQWMRGHLISSTDGNISRTTSLNPQGGRDEPKARALDGAERQPLKGGRCKTKSMSPSGGPEAQPQGRERRELARGETPINTMNGVQGESASVSKRHDASRIGSESGADFLFHTGFNLAQPKINETRRNDLPADSRAHCACRQ